MGTTPNYIEQTRWTNLGESFIALGNVLQHQPHSTENIALEAKTVYANVYQQVCRFCSKVRWCWGEEQSYTIEELHNICNVLSAQGLCKASACSTKFQGRCVQYRQIELALFHQVTRSYEQTQIYHSYLDNKANIAQQLLLLGEQMKHMRSTAEKAEDHPEHLAVGYACSRKEHISGDSWGVIDLQDGRLVQILCDGMGSGALAMEQSSTAVQLLKTLLAGGLSIRLSLNIMNTVLALQYNGARFSTADVAVWNLNTKKIELYKYGAAPSFVRNGKTISTYESQSLPVGMLPRVEGSRAEHTIQHGDLLIMMSDGLYELTSTRFQWEEVIR